MRIDFIILAAGKGKRMVGHVPKALKVLGGKPMAQHVLDTAILFSNSKRLVVVGDRHKEVKSSLNVTKSLSWVHQKKQLGTGHAVKQCLGHLRKGSIVVILYGDVPLVGSKTLNKLIKVAQKKYLGLLTMEPESPQGYGRIIRGSNKEILGIREEKDTSPEQKKIKEVNSGIMALHSDLLKKWIPDIKNNNSSKEYYLTDIVEIAKNSGFSIKGVRPLYKEETLGANNAEELHLLERIYQKREALRLIKKGVRFGDLNRFDVRGNLDAGPGCFVDVNCVFEGQVTLGKNINIGPNCYIRNSSIANGTKVLANSVIEDSSVGIDSVLGPFARVRGGSEIQDHVDLGNFVEVNRSYVGSNSKAKHLTYLGDTKTGKSSNIGAGTITCNYDGEKKSTTIIEEGAFIGSNTSLVAPVRVGKGAYTGAGSVITKNIPEGNLAIARSRQVNLEKKKKK